MMRSAQEWLQEMWLTSQRDLASIRAIQADAARGEYERGFAEAVEAAVEICLEEDEDVIIDRIRALKPDAPPPLKP